jgi:hypothetical protein
MTKIESGLKTIEGKIIYLDAAQNKISGFGYFSTLYSAIMPKVLEKNDSDQN